ncbi:UNKNOWN [Stylonychia lemnae]|uniref:Transmembrane protein n=1 Tax=Stylonychia lemnae TaxID=5949 RepID=A0A078BC67_STYLE|nr:UNKNOWN [Stylonychia lemnae]|eukprot:CDW90837.1 UNKNOWN [Stylonychia lemnae]
MSEFSSHMKFANEERLKEIKEQKIVRKFQKQLKICAYFFLFWATFILLNSCIGFSSAPFYLPEVKCNHLEPSDNCKYLKSLTSALYCFEIIGSLLLVIHGLLLIALIDHIKHLKLIRLIQRFTKVVIILYLVLIVLRIGVYIKVQSEVASIDSNETDQGFGNFLASFVDDPQTAIAVTCILMSCFFLCFLMNCFTVRLTNKIEAFIIKPPPENGSLQINSETKRSSSDGSGDDNKRKSSQDSNGSSDNNSTKQKTNKSSKLFFWKRKESNNSKIRSQSSRLLQDEEQKEEDDAMDDNNKSNKYRKQT